MNSAAELGLTVGHIGRRRPEMFIMHDPHRVADELEDCFAREEAERIAVFVWWIEHKGHVDREQVVKFLAESFTQEQAEGLAEVAGYRSE